MGDKNSRSPSNPSSPNAPVAPPGDIIEAAPAEEVDVQDDADSALGDDTASSSASVSSSILQYRTLHGRTYHSERHNTEYFTPNDDQQAESIDLTHHYVTLLTEGKLFLAPIKDDVHRVIDIGTGTGIWAIDFADEHPNAEIIGTDLSPIQPSWVPPNVKFEIDDFSQQWTWGEDTFDFVHIRYLMGAVSDWTELFKQAYRVCKPGGWIETCDADAIFLCDDGTADEDYAIQTWSKLFREGGKAMGRSFAPVSDDVQRKGLEEAGFVDIQVKTYKIPVGGWARDPNLAEVGRIISLTMLNDLEGYTQYLWKNALQWPLDEFQVFLMEMRKLLRSQYRYKHAYSLCRFVWGRKPE